MPYTWESAYTFGQQAHLSIIITPGNLVCEGAGYRWEGKKAGEPALSPAREHQTSLRHPGGSCRTGQRAVGLNWLVLVLFRFCFFTVTKVSETTLRNRTGAESYFHCKIHS